MASDAAVRPDRTPLSIIALVMLGLLVIAGGVFWYLERAAKQAANPDQLTAEAKSYVGNLKLSDVGIKATENMMHQSVVEILGKITNSGDRTVKAAALYCLFYDRNGQPIARERATLLKSSSGGLAPGATREFRLAFDNVPDTWNNTMPRLVIAQVQF